MMIQKRRPLVSTINGNMTRVLLTNLYAKIKNVRLLPKSVRTMTSNAIQTRRRLYAMKMAIGLIQHALEMNFVIKANVSFAKTVKLNVAIIIGRF